MSSNPAVTIGVSAVDTSKAVLEGVDSKVSQTADIVASSGDKMATTTAKASSAIMKNWQGLAVGAATLGAGIVSFATSFDVLEKAQVRADQATLAYNRAVERLKDLQASGKASAQDLANAQDAVTIASDKARLAQDAQSDTYTNFLAQVPLQLMSFGTSAISMYTALTGAELSATAAAGALRTAMTFLAAHPIIFALTGIATLIILVMTNTFGLRDAFVGLGKVMLDFLDRHFKPLADALRWFIDGIQWLAGQFNTDLPSSIDTSASAVSEFAQVTQATNEVLASTDTQLQALQSDLDTGIPSAVESATASLDVLDKKLVEVTDKAIAMHSSLRGNEREESKGGIGFGRLGRSAQAAREKYGDDVDLDYIGGKWVLGGKRKGRIVSENVDAYLRRARRDGLTNDEIQGASKFGTPNVNVTVIDTGKGYDITVETDGYSKTFRTLKATSQVLAGVGQ